MADIVELTRTLGSSAVEISKNFYDADGRLRVGLYLGEADSVEFRKTTALKRKRWQFYSGATNEILFGCGIVDISYAANSFLTVVDLKTKKKIVDVSHMAMPGVTLSVNEYPYTNAHARLKQPGVEFDLSEKEGTLFYRAEGKAESTSFVIDSRAVRQGAVSSVIALAEPEKGLAAYTQKTNLLSLSGKIEVGNRTYMLDGGFSGSDFTSGELPRKTQWYWAFALGKTDSGVALGFNLALGNNLGGQSENALWVGERVYMLSPAVFEFDSKNLMAPWKVRTQDGALDLVFEPVGLHKEDKNLWLVQSNFAQLFGVYSGSILNPTTGVRERIVGLPGIAEDQRVKW